MLDGQQLRYLRSDLAGCCTPAPGTHQVQPQPYLQLLPGCLCLLQLCRHRRKLLTQRSAVGNKGRRLAGAAGHPPPQRLGLRLRRHAGCRAAEAGMRTGTGMGMASLAAALRPRH